MGLSIKAKDQADEKAAVADLKNQEPESASGPTTIGDLIKQQMADKD